MSKWDGNLLIILYSLPQDEKITALSQIKNEEFGKIIIKVCRKIIELKNIEIQFPLTLSPEMNKRYQEAQKVVEFVKHQGFKSDLNINNILFPSRRDMQRLFEFTLELITSSDTGANDFTQGMNEKNFGKLKIAKLLSSWIQDLWVVPELNNNLYPPSTNVVNGDYYLKHNNTKISAFRKVINSNKNYITEDLSKSIIVYFIITIVLASQKTTEAITNSSKIKFIEEEDNPLLKYSSTDQNHNFIVNKLKTKNTNTQIEKTTNQTFVECINDRNHAMDFLYKNHKENNFVNNIHIINKKNRDLFLTTFMPSISLSSGSMSLLTTNDSTSNKYEENKHEGEITENVSASSLYQSKMDNIMNQFEKEKQQKNEEIQELNNRLFNISNKIEKLRENQKDNTQIKKELLDQIASLTSQNQALLKDIEDQMTAFEQMKKLETSEIQEDDIVEEVQKFEKKYFEMMQNWGEYSNQAKAQIEENKSAIETKKKEYNYKYEQIAILKKEIVEISTKIEMKQELAAFLSEESQKMGNINRNHFINKIAELTKNINEERKKMVTYINDLKASDAKIEQINETIKRVDNELEDKLYQDAKSTANLKEVYNGFIKLREGYNLIQKNILDFNNVKHKSKEIINKVDDYTMKLKSYDIKQLQEQVDYLKKANEGK